MTCKKDSQAASGSKRKNCSPSPEPKKAAKGKGKGKAKASSPATQVPASTSTGLNAAFWMEMAGNIDQVLATDGFADLATAPALGLEDGGHGLGFSPELVASSLQRTNKHVCTMSLFQIANKSPNRAPIARASIDMLKNRLFVLSDGSVQPASIQVTVGIERGSLQAGTDLAKPRVFTLITPEEVLMAFWLTFSQSTQLPGWRTAALSCTAEILVFEDDNDAWRLAANKREETTDFHTALGRTGFQRIFDVITLKH